MSYREQGSLYDYDYEDEDDNVLLYSPNDVYEEVHVVEERPDDSDAETLPHQLEEIQFQNVNDSVPFYGQTTSKAEYTWKVPNRRERRTSGSEQTDVEKIPFYSETTHRSQYVPFDASVARTRPSRKLSTLPTSNVPLASETTYRNLFQELEIGKRQKLIQTCPAEKLIHRTDLLRQSRRDNGHFFLTLSHSSTNTTVHPTPLLKQNGNDEKK